MPERTPGRVRRRVHGHVLGVLMLDTRFPRPPGDVGNALTWPFPVRYRIVDTAHSSRIMGAKPDPALLPLFVDAARDLEAEGVRAITTSCGFLGVYQRELAAAVSVPVLTSALLQVPFASRLLRPDQRVAILTERPNLTERHFNGAGWSAHDVPVTVMALPDDAVFPRVHIDQTLQADVKALEAEMVELARRTVQLHPDVGALVLECTNFVPYSRSMRVATGLPVFDLYTLVTQVYHATVGRVGAA
jgi:hypothetical protein